MPTLIFRRLIIGKNENWYLLLFHCRYFDKSFLEMVVECPLPNIYFFSKPLNLISCHGNQKAKFSKKYLTLNSSEAILGIKLKLCRNIHSISLYKSIVFYCCCLCTLIAMATYEFP